MGFFGAIILAAVGTTHVQNTTQQRKETWTDKTKEISTQVKQKAKRLEFLAEFHHTLGA